VIGEDLGTVPPGFSQQLADAGVLGIRALWFQREGPAFLPPQAWPASAMATTSTHDLCTVAGWWAGRDIDRREALGLLGSQPTRQAARAANARPEKPRCKTALQETLQEDTMADAWPKTHRWARCSPMWAAPGAAGARAARRRARHRRATESAGHRRRPPNWRQRLPQDAAALLDAPQARQRLARLAAARREAAPILCMGAGCMSLPRATVRLQLHRGLRFRRCGRLRRLLRGARHQPLLPLADLGGAARVAAWL
jgi:4-alpha-glucanotransferase